MWQSPIPLKANSPIVPLQVSKMSPLCELIYFSFVYRLKMILPSQKLLAPVIYGTPIFCDEYLDGDKSTPEIRLITRDNLVFAHPLGKFS